MKKIFFVLSLNAFFAVNLFSQEKNVVDSAHHFQRYFYSGVDGGYGFAACKEYLGYDDNISSTSSIEKGVYSSLGKGIIGSLNLGYMLSRHLGIETGFSILEGSKLSVNTYDSYISTQSETENYYSSLMRFHLGVKISTGKSWWRPYCRMAIMVGFNGKIIYGTKEVDGQGLISTSTETYSGGLSFGFKGGAGISFFEKNKFSFYAEVGMNYQNWAPKDGLLTSEIEKGVDVYNTLSFGQIHTNFVSSINTSASQGPNQARQEIKNYFPFSSIGMNIGVQYKFGK